MNRRGLALGMVQLLLLGSCLKSCTVSMEEPFKAITIRDLFWQVIAPSVVATSMIWLGTLVLVGHPLEGSRRSWKVAWLVMVLFMLLVSLEPIYGYVWDMKTHMGIR